MPTKDQVGEGDREKGEITQLLHRWGGGDREAFAALTPLVYDQLRVLAGSFAQRNLAAGQVQATELVNQVFLELLQRSKASLTDRRHFFNLAARIMRGILIDQARAAKAAKRGGDVVHFPLNAELAWVGHDDLPATLDLETALDDLAALDPDKATAIELRYFFGFTAEETAEFLALSKASVDRMVRFSLVWLHQRLRNLSKT